MTETDREIIDTQMIVAGRGIEKFLTDLEIPLRHRLVLYLATPSVCRSCYTSIPKFPLTEAEYGPIDWKRDFPYLRKDQTVNLVLMIDCLTKGIETYFPKFWTDDMLYLFVKDCVDNAIHEFDYII